jgi:hypothetical protein
MSENALGATPDPSKVSHGFFAIDRGAFRYAVVGGLNVAVAHLVWSEARPRQPQGAGPCSGENARCRR